MRIERIKELLNPKKAFPYMICDSKNISYLTGFDGSYARLFIDADITILLTDSRYSEYAEQVFAGGRVIIQKESFSKTLEAIAKQYKWDKLNVEDTLILSEFQALQNSNQFLNFIPAHEYCATLRYIKDEEEISTIRKAAALADSCFEAIMPLLKEGVSEWDISAEIEYYFRKHGASGSSFETIVAFGAHSSMPHYKTGNTKLRNSDAILIDTGCIVDSYCSDITRTFFLGKPEPEMEKIYAIVNHARAAAIEKITPGIDAGILDRCARDIITEKGYGEAFGHSLGHGVGRDVHEEPRVKHASDQKLEPGCVITIEPGIYLPGKGGVRIEDMVVVTHKGAEILTTSSRHLNIL